MIAQWTWSPKACMFFYRGPGYALPTSSVHVYLACYGAAIYRSKCDVHACVSSLHTTIFNYSQYDCGDSANELLAKEAMQLSKTLLLHTTTVSHPMSGPPGCEGEGGRLTPSIPCLQAWPTPLNTHLSSHKYCDNIFYVSSRLGFFSPPNSF